MPPYASIFFSPQGGCAKKQRGCTGQSDKAKAKRAETKALAKEARKKRIQALKIEELKAKNETGETELTPEQEQEIEDEVEAILVKTQEAKKAMLRAQGFNETDVRHAQSM